MRGLFITVEGGDGAGKSTHAGKLEAFLVAQGRDVVRTREPGGTDLGQQLRQILLHHPGELHPRAEALIFAADRAHHIATLVRPALAAGKVVLQDRYIDSSVAYQGSGRALGADDIRKLSEWATEGLTPDLTILLDIDPREARARMLGERAALDRLESLDLSFHEQVRAQYLAQAAAAPQRYLVVDVSEPVDVVAERIRNRTAELLAEHA